MSFVDDPRVSPGLEHRLSPAQRVPQLRLFYIALLLNSQIEPHFIISVHRWNVLALPLRNFVQNYITLHIAIYDNGSSRNLNAGAICFL